jgi:shikimate kinase
MRVYLMGFMGAGKTTVGRALAARLGWPFVDLDDEIEAAAGATVRDIFAARGEAAFRLLEREALSRTLERDPLVVATGGGTFTQSANLDAVRPGGLTVWLNPPFAAIVARVGALGKEDRPLYRDETQAWALYRERLPVYRRADLILDVSPDEQPEEIASRLALRLAEHTCAS